MVKLQELLDDFKNGLPSPERKTPDNIKFKIKDKEYHLMFRVGNYPLAGIANKLQIRDELDALGIRDQMINALDINFVLESGGVGEKDGQGIENFADIGIVITLMKTVTKYTIEYVVSHPEVNGILFGCDGESKIKAYGVFARLIERHGWKVFSKEGMGPYGDMGMFWAGFDIERLR